MNEQRLNSLLAHVKNYQGSFAVDELNQIKLRYPSLFVVNLDERGDKGTHWIGVAVYQNVVYLCDTLGGISPDRKTHSKWTYFLKIITMNRKLVLTKRLSEKGLCGLFCVTFIKEMSRTNNFSDFIQLFSSDLSTNDNVVKFLNKKSI